MKCKECGSKLWFIEERGCEDCEHNGIYREHVGYVYEEPFEDETRNQVWMEGECKLGSCYDQGCMIFTCSVCGWISFKPFAGDY